MGDQPMGAAAVDGRAARTRAVAWQVLCLHALTAATAVSVAIAPGASRGVARTLNLSFDPPPPTIQEAAGILASNGKVIAAILLLGVAARRALLTHRMARMLTAALVVLNASLVGAAIGAYGLATTAPWLIHIPLEWTALAVAAATLASPGRGLSAASAAAIAAPLLVAAAVVETYATPIAP